MGCSNSAVNRTTAIRTLAAWRSDRRQSLLRPTPIPKQPMTADFGGMTDQINTFNICPKCREKGRYKKRSRPTRPQTPSKNMTPPEISINHIHSRKKLSKKSIHREETNNHNLNNTHPHNPNVDNDGVPDHKKHTLQPNGWESVSRYNSPSFGLIERGGKPNAFDHAKRRPPGPWEVPDIIGFAINPLKDLNGLKSTGEISALFEQMEGGKTHKL